MSKTLAVTPHEPFTIDLAARLPCGCSVNIFVTLEITDFFPELARPLLAFDAARYYADRNRKDGASIVALMTDTRVCVDAINALLDIMGWTQGPGMFLEGAVHLGPDAVTHMSPTYIVLQNVMYWIFALRCQGIIPIGLTSLDPPYEINRELDATWYSKHRLCTLSRTRWKEPSFRHCGDSPGAGVRNVFPEVMRILLPKFHEMHVRIQTLTAPYRLESVSEIAPDRSDSLSNVMLCLDVAESLAKLVPGFGALAEGICGAVRKIISMAQCARAVKDDCLSLVKHAAMITLAVFTEVSSTAGPIVIDSNLLELWSTVQDVERQIAALSRLRRYKYFLHRTRISQEINELRSRLDNARMAFRIRSDLTTRQLLMDLRNLQRQLVVRVEEVHRTQMIHHRETNEKLDFLVHATIGS